MYELFAKENLNIILTTSFSEIQTHRKQYQNLVMQHNTLREEPDQYYFTAETAGNTI